MAIDDDSLEDCGHPTSDKWLDDGECILTLGECDYVADSLETTDAFCSKCERSMDAHIQKIIKAGFVSKMYRRKLYTRQVAYVNETSTVCRFLCDDLSPIKDQWWFPHLKRVDLSDWPNFVQKYDCPYFHAFIQANKIGKPKQVLWMHDLHMVVIYDLEFYVFATVNDRDPDEIRVDYDPAFKAKVKT